MDAKPNGVEPGPQRSIRWSLAPLRTKPRADASLGTEALRGEAVICLGDDIEGWTPARLERDGYEGYLPTESLGPFEAPTHRVAALRSLLYPGPDLKLPPIGFLPLGSRCKVTGMDAGYCALEDGFVWASHLVSAESREADFVAVAERFSGVPYLWGGKSSLGLDCSGLLQISLDAAGVAAPRDSGPQQRALGVPIGHDAELRRGDLVFWKGHVGIMRDGVHLIHANAHTMTVSSETLVEARARIESAPGVEIASIHRLEPTTGL